ncbi:MAG: hypothetical protein COB20_15430, partial [SAR86 cluster bacterium]
MAWVSLLLATIVHGQDVLEVVDDDLLTQREQLQQQLTDLESTLGRYDPALIEILSSLADSSTPLNLFSEASTLLGRSLQIQRLSLGLFTPAQIPLILAKMEVDARAGDWETVNESMDYLYWLLIGKNVSEGEALVNSLIRLSEFHLRGVVGDTANLQAHHYQQAFKITYQALMVSEEFLGPDGPHLIDLHYSLVKQVYLQSAAVERGGDTAYALRAVVPRSKWVRPRRIAQSRYYRAGSELLSDIREIIAQSYEGPAESLAMVDLYVADWHLLFDQGQAEAAYMNAFTGLQAAGVGTAELNLLFSTPKILPIPAFHSTVSTALTGNQSAEQGKEPESSLYYKQWLDAMSVVSLPVIARSPGLAKQEQLPEIRLRFSLDSLSNVSHWVNGRYRTNMSVAKEFDIIEPDENSGFYIEVLDEDLRLL